MSAFRSRESGSIALLSAVLLALPTCSATAMQMDPGMVMPMPAPVEKPAPPEPARKPAHKHAHGDSHHAMPKPATDGADVDHAAMDMGDMDMDGMDMSTPAGAAPAPPMDHSGMAGMSMAPDQPVTPIPALTDADRAAAMPPMGGHAAHDNSIQNQTLIDRLETAKADSIEWDATTWIGTDLNRLWLRTEGVRVGGRTQVADLELLYGRSVATWWDVVAGVRHDFKPGASQDFVALGVMGTAPYKIETRATVYIGQGGQTAARVEAEYETLLTNRLILQPRIEFNAFGQDDPRRGAGSGVGMIEAGLRLRYEFSRRFAPYIGVVRERAFGATADYRRDAGESVDDTRFVTGVRLRF